MKSLLVVCRFSIVLAMLLLDGRAIAQGGCDIGITSVDTEEKCNGVPIVDQYCEGSGTPGYACYEGSGVCSQTGYEYTSANIAPDSYCDSRVLFQSYDLQQ